LGGWNVFVIWECAISKKRKLSDDLLLDAITDAIRSEMGFREIRGVSL
jgi:G:T-mismatch repair DNA endonuclease (very short patch repair protein)